MSARLPRNPIMRRDLVQQTGEKWRPPLFIASPAQTSRLVAMARRAFDLQAGSIWADLKKMLPLVEGHVLDVGCGAQPYRTLFSGQVQYIGIDTKDAKSHFGYEVPDTRYFQGAVWPIDSGWADFVLCTETLEHVPDPRGFLEEAYRSMAPGGTILLTVPFAARWHFIPHDYWRFTPSGLDRLLGASCFTDIRVYARGNAVTVACYKVMALILRLAMPQTTKGLMRVSLQLLSIAFAPFLILLATVANFSLMGEGGDDCIGYTVIAEKPG